MVNIDTSMFYNPHSMLTHKSKYNFIVSMRGLGKTYAITKFLVKQFLKHGYQFVYLRRYKEEIGQPILSRFFKNVENDPELKGIKFNIKGKNFYINDRLCGLAIALSQAGYIKSIALPDTQYIMFDEFQLDLSVGNVRYMPNEPRMLKDLVETVFRHRNNWQVFCLSNAVSAYNPYFTAYKIYPNPNKEFTKRSIYLIQLPDSKDFLTYKIEQTEAGAENKNSDYGQYALYNVFSQDNHEFIARKTHTSNIHAIFIYNKQYIGFWLDAVNSMIYVSHDYPKNFRHIFTAQYDDMTTNTVLAKDLSKNPRLMYLRHLYRQGRVRYENMKIKTLAIDMFSKLYF